MQSKGLMVAALTARIPFQAASLRAVAAQETVLSTFTKLFWHKVCLPGSCNAENFV